MDSKKTKLKQNNRINNNSSGSISGSKRFLLCFRPVVVDMDDDSGKQVFTYVAMGEKEGVVFPNQILQGLSEDGLQKTKKKDGHRSFSRILKAVLFETSLVKKIKKRRLQQKLNQSNSNLLAKSEKISKESKPINKNSTQNQELSSPSRSLPSRIKSSRSNSIDTNQRLGNLQEHGKGCYSSNIGLCLLLISFLVLVFWGKICAICCTSTWLFFVPRLSNDYNSSQNGLLDIDSEEYKKKIIMEGLLERNRTRGRGSAAYVTHGDNS